MCLVYLLGVGLSLLGIDLALLGIGLSHLGIGLPHLGTVIYLAHLVLFDVLDFNLPTFIHETKYSSQPIGETFLVVFI